MLVDELFAKSLQSLFVLVNHLSVSEQRDEISYIVIHLEMITQIIIFNSILVIPIYW